MFKKIIECIKYNPQLPALTLVSDIVLCSVAVLFVIAMSN